MNATKRYKKENKSVEAVAEPINSCKFSVNAKGNISAELKVYATTIEEARTKAIAEVELMLKYIKEKNGDLNETNKKRFCGKKRKISL